MALTKEELAELRALEADEKKAAEAAADADLRLRLEAKRMRKRIGAKGLEHGKDFIVVEVPAAGVALAFRRPTDVEVDTYAESDDGRAGIEKFTIGLLIEPAKDVVEELFAKFAGMAPSLDTPIASMLGKVREEEAKK